jgi:ABC-type sugar transport system permease subunit
MNDLVINKKGTVLKKDSLKKRIKKSMSAYFFLLPFYIFSFLFAILPLFWVFKLSFQTEGVLKPAEWVGLENYIKIFRNEEYFGYLLNNFTFISLTVPFGQLFAFIIALLLRKKTKISPLFEGIFFLPLLISMVAAGVVMLYIFSRTGPVNYLLSLFGIEELNWFGHPFRAKVVIAVLEIWKGGTFHTFIYLAALRAIPAEYYEVARIAGARFFQTLRHVTIPLIRHSMLFCITMTTIWGLQIFDSIYSTTQGSPLNSTVSVVYEVYKTSFKHNNIGLGAALSILFLFVILIISTIQRKVMRTDVEY